MSDQSRKKRFLYGKYRLLNIKYERALDQDSDNVVTLHNMVESAWTKYVRLGGEQPPLHFTEVDV